MALDNEFILSELIKKGSAALKQEVTETGTIIVDTAKDTDGETFGYVERPIYNEQQLVKAVDIVVDELISPDQELGPQTVLKTTYNDLEELYRQSLVDIQDLREQVNDLTTENENLKNQIDDLTRQLDLANLLKASADNEKEAVNQSLQQVSMDLQAALIKGTKEAVERVSREASLQGALAQKEAFTKIQEDSKKSIEEANKTILGLQDTLANIQLAYTDAVAKFQEA